MSKEHSDFGAWVRDCRKSRKWTQNQLAQKSFISIETIRKIEQNRYHPSEGMIEKLAQTLEIPDNERPYFQTLGRQQTKSAEIPTPVSTQPKRSGFGCSIWIFWGGMIILLIIGIGWSVRNHLSSQVGMTALYGNNGLVVMETVNNKIVANSEHISGEHTDGGTIKVGELVTVTFQVQNVDTHPIKITTLVMGGRGPNAQKLDWGAPNVGFPVVHDLFLQPGEIYEYRQSSAFYQPGDYFIEPNIQDAVGRWGGIQPFTRIDFSVIQ